jgi:outer membrane protein assembly factor BamB
MPLYLRPLAVLLASLVFPPAGLVLLWMRPGGVLRKVLLSLPILALAIVHLFLFYGLRVEMYGGLRPHLVFDRPESRYRALEESRAAHAKAAPIPETPAEAPAGQRRAQDAGGQAAPGPAPAGPRVQDPTAQAANAPAATQLRGSTYWTDFRGPGRLGHYDQAPILTTWPAEGLKRLWKQPSGGGYASFTVAHDVAFTIEQRRGNEVVAAYDLSTGRERWTHSWAALFSEALGGDGPRATPVWDDGRLYALGATGELRCLDAANGRTIWRKNILEENGARNIQWGMAGSPLVLDRLVIVQPGGSDGRSIVAYDKRTGERAWSSQDDKAAYVSAVLATVAGNPQVLTLTATRAIGLSPSDGTLLWEFPWATSNGINTVEPIQVAPNRVFFSSGYDHGAALVELAAPAGAIQATAIWSNKRMKAKFNGPVLYEGHVYGLDEGILACVDAATGDQRWKGGRYGYGQLLLASGHLVVLSEEGEVVLVRATPERLDERARFTAISGKTWNYPAISDGVLLVRNEEEMAAFQIGAQ